MKLQHYFMLLAIVLLLSCKNEKKPQSRWAHIPIPEAKIIPDTLTIHGNLRIDNYFWMRLSDEQKNVESQDAQTQDVMEYINAENAYLNEVMEPTMELQDTLYNEIVGRIKKNDNLLIMDCNMETGHGGVSSRFERYKRTALV